jgi:hypothetical protein
MVGSSCAGTLSRPTKKAWARNRSVGIPSQIADGWAPTLKRLRTGKIGANLFKELDGLWRLRAPEEACDEESKTTVISFIIADC